MWPEGALEPRPAEIVIDQPLRLGREFLGVDDNTISRAANAATLSPGAPSATLHVPGHCANSALVIHGCGFEQLAVGSGRGTWLSPDRLGLPETIALGPRTSAALLRSWERGQPGPTDHLIALPRAERVRPGQSTTLEDPALVVVGGSAVSVASTHGPARAPLRTALPPSRSFRLPTGTLPLAAARELDDFVNAKAPSVVHLGGWDHACTPTDLSEVAFLVLERLERPFAFVPALVEGHEPRLALLVARPNGTARALVSEADVSEWLGPLSTGGWLDPG